jgi:Ca2+-binding RTX toxin-like protein
MAVVAGFNPGDIVTGTSAGDYIYDPFGGATTAYGDSGNDVIYGDSGPASPSMATSAGGPLSLPITSIGGGFWTRSFNPEIQNSTTVSHFSFLIDGYFSDDFGWLAVNVAAGATITLDVDHGYEVLDDTNTALAIFAGDGLTQLSANLDSSSLDVGSASVLDSFLSYTFATTGTYLVRVSDYYGSRSRPLTEEDSFALHVSLTGQAFGSGVLAGGDSLYGGFGDDTIYGMGGDDILYGQDDNDLIFGGADNDTIYGGSAPVDATDIGNDILYGDEGLDTIYGNGGDDTIYGGLGSDFLIGGTGVDFIYGGSSETDTVDMADDFIRGGAGFDMLYGNGGNDTIYGGEGGDNIQGGEGNDVILGGGLAVDPTDLGDIISGGNGNDDIRGNGGDDYLNGDDGDDTIIGGLGTDFIKGGSGNDYLRGGLDLDYFVFDTALNATTNMDTIQAFVVGTDLIGLSQAIFAGIGAVLDASEIQFGTAANDAAQRIIYNSTTGQLFYDSNGNVNGSADQVLFATLTSPTGVLTLADFVMLA